MSASEIDELTSLWLIYTLKQGDISAPRTGPRCSHVRDRAHDDGSGTALLGHENEPTS